MRLTGEPGYMVVENDRSNFMSKSLLTEIYEERYGTLELGTPECWENLKQLAQELSDLVGRELPWGKRYLYSILKLFAAIYLDDTDPLIARLNKRIVYSSNGLRPGSIVLGHSVQCPICQKWIVPRTPNGKYCDECRSQARKWRKYQGHKSI